MTCRQQGWEPLCSTRGVLNNLLEHLGVQTYPKLIHSTVSHVSSQNLPLLFLGTSYSCCPLHADQMGGVSMYLKLAPMHLFLNLLPIGFPLSIRQWESPTPPTPAAAPPHDLTPMRKAQEASSFLTSPNPRSTHRLRIWNSGPNTVQHSAHFGVQGSNPRMHHAVWDPGSDQGTMKGYSWKLVKLK